MFAVVNGRRLLNGSPMFLSAKPSVKLVLWSREAIDFLSLEIKQLKERAGEKEREIERERPRQTGTEMSTQAGKHTKRETERKRAE